MPRIQFLRQSFAPIEVAQGANLMKSLLAGQVPVASSCLGDGICGKCRLRVQAEVGACSAATDKEKLLIARDKLGPEWRISCQVTVYADLVVDASYW